MKNTRSRNTRASEEKPNGPSECVPVKFPASDAKMLRLAAKGATEGNVSEFVRQAVREHVARILAA